MSGYRSIGIEYHGPPLDDDGNSIPGENDIHIRVWLGCNDDDYIPDAIFQLDSHEDLSKSQSFMSSSISVDERAELEMLRDLRQLVIRFGDDDFTIMPWIDAHRHHADKPYIGCPFCRDRFVAIDALVTDESYEAFRVGANEVDRRPTSDLRSIEKAGLRALADHLTGQART